jgi:hypothetical protein
MNKRISVTMEVPDWAVCLVTEQSGHVYAWDMVPKAISEAGVWNCAGRCRRLFGYANPCEEWKESLVMLPQGKED